PGVPADPGEQRRGLAARGGAGRPGAPPRAPPRPRATAPRLQLPITAPRHRRTEENHTMTATLFIDGRWTAASDGGTRLIRCPADGSEVATVSEATRED